MSTSSQSSAGTPPTPPLRVCFVSLQARGAFVGGPGAKLGGTETQIRLLADYLTAHGNCAVSLLVEDQGQPDVEELPGAVLYKIPQPPPGSGLQRVRRLVASAWNLVRAGRRVDADVYVQQCAGIETALTAQMARNAGAGFVYMMASDSELAPPWSSGGGLPQRGFRWGLRRADAVTAQHGEQLAGIARTFGREAVEVRNVFNFPQLAAAAGGTASAPRSGALWVGRARTLKGPQHFLALARALPQFTFTLVALPTEVEPEFAAQLEREARALPNVEFHPGLSPAELVPLYQTRGVLVNTSDYEGMPNTFIEAAGHGLALASLRVDPGGMLSTGRAGLCAGGDTDKLTHLVRGLLTDEVGRSRWAERAREFLIANHDINTIGPHFVELLRAAAAAHGRPRP